MSLSKSTRFAIENYMLDKIGNEETDVVKKTMSAFSVSSNTVYRYLNNLIDSESIEKERNGVYRLKSTTKVFTLRRDLNELVDEQRIYEKHVYPEFIEDLPENVRRIWDFSFTEMMNNAIDHSCAQEVTCLVSKNRASTTILIADNGIGIFRNIRDFLGLDSLEDAIQELFKGRVTTDSANHSGEGIFFTSRYVDDFAAISDGKMFTHNRYEDIVSDLDEIKGLENLLEWKGTLIYMKQSNVSNKEVEDITRRYEDEETSEFSKTSIPLKEFFDTYPVSRSQAKRLCARLNVFSEIELDFNGVSDMGQGFADEVFRVFQSRNPDIRIIAANMSENVERMYNHVRRKQ